MITRRLCAHAAMLGRFGPCRRCGLRSGRVSRRRAVGCAVPAGDLPRFLGCVELSGPLADAVDVSRWSIRLPLKTVKSLHVNVLKRLGQGVGMPLPMLPDRKPREGEEG